MLIATRLVTGHAVKSVPSKVEAVGAAVVMRMLSGSGAALDRYAVVSQALCTHRAPIAPLKAASKGTIAVVIPGPDALADEPCDAFALELWRLFSAMRRVMGGGGWGGAPDGGIHTSTGVKPRKSSSCAEIDVLCWTSGHWTPAMAIGARVCSTRSLPFSI